MAIASLRVSSFQEIRRTHLCYKNPEYLPSKILLFASKENRVWGSCGHQHSFREELKYFIM